MVSVVPDPYPYALYPLLAIQSISKNTKKRLIMAQNRNQEGQMNQKSRRGFAAMDPERQRQIASEGGRAAHRQGVAHEWTADEARLAGRKGGQNSKGSRGTRPNDARRNGINLLHVISFLLQARKRAFFIGCLSRLVRSNTPGECL